MTDPTTAIPTAPKAEFLEGPAPRSKTVPLKWPVMIDGVTYAELTIRRMNGREAQQYYAACMATLSYGTPAQVCPCLDLPQAVWEELDDDDVTAIDQEIEAFLPERFAPLTALLGKMMGRPDESDEPLGGPNSEPGES